MNARSAKLADIGHAVTDFEGELRELIRADVGFLHKAHAGAAADGNVSSLVQRVAGSAADDIDGLIAQLQDLRDLMHNEGERVRREIAAYAQLSQSARGHVESIADQLQEWRAAMPLGRGGAG